MSASLHCGAYSGRSCFWKLHVVRLEKRACLVKKQGDSFGDTSTMRHCAEEVVQSLRCSPSYDPVWLE